MISGTPVILASGSLEATLNKTINDWSHILVHKPLYSQNNRNTQTIKSILNCLESSSHLLYDFGWKPLLIITEVLLWQSRAYAKENIARSSRIINENGIIA